MQFQRETIRLIREEKVKESNELLKEWKTKESKSSISLDGVDFSGLNLREIDFSDISLKNSNFSGCVLALADFSNCDLENSCFNNAGLMSANFTSSNLKNTSFLEAKLQAVHFNNSNLEGCLFSTKVDFSGADFSNTNLNNRNFKGSDFESCIFKNTSLRNANLESADLTNATLHDCNFQEANLYGVNLNQAVIVRSVFSRAIMTKCFLKGTSLMAVEMSKVNLELASLENSQFTDCTMVNSILKEARLLDTYISGTDLSISNLEQTLLIRARFIRTNLKNCSFEKAVVGDIHLSELQGFPLPPNELWEDPLGEKRILGKDAADFFLLPAIVEVYLDKPLSPNEYGVYNFHIGEMQFRKIGDGVFIVAHWYNFEGSVIRFQGRSFQDIYNALPDFLAPFRTSKFIDWKLTSSKLGDNERVEALKSLIRIVPTKQKWHYADLMMNFFETFQYAKVTKIKEGKGRGFFIEVFSNKQLQEKSKNEMLAPRNLAQMQITLLGDGTSVKVIQAENNKMETNTITGSQIGNFSTGIQANVQVITNNTFKISDSGLQELANAFSAITEATVTSEEIPENEKADLLEQIKELTEQANLPREERKNAVIKAVIIGLATSYAAFANFSSIWSLWGNIICNYFGVENPIKP